MENSNAQSAPVEIQCGNPKQHRYAMALMRRLPESDIDQICAQVLGAHPPEGVVSVPDASKVIDHLQQVLGVSPREKRNGSASDKAHRTLNATQLRAIVSNQAPRPHSLDGDSSWVLEMLSRMLAVKEIVVADESGQGANKGGPIRMTALVEYFGGWDALASAFEVTVSTARAWGETLPSARQYEAEVKTNRTFRAQP